MSPIVTNIHEVPQITNDFHQKSKYSYYTLSVIIQVSTLLPYIRDCFLNFFSLPWKNCCVKSKVKWTADRVHQDKATSHRKPLTCKTSTCHPFTCEKRVQVPDARNLAGNKNPAQLETQQRNSMQSAVTNHLFKEKFLWIPIKTALSCRLGVILRGGLTGILLIV